MRTATRSRPLLAVALVAASALLPAACTSTPLEPPHWPIAVTPARETPERLVAVPPDCGPVPTTLPDAEVRPGPWHDGGLGLGCATARNLAVTVEQPRDLLGGRALAPGDAEREAAAVRRYRQGQEKALQRETTRGGAAAGS
ncbi:CpaD family pilus assembly lipoprotein [Azospirillum sp. ST 5-10]|uniref:CpaD family pilus assembly lipoprotein n=1 Tax=unclassified Azospirillum TaxID=2630922 RepID=UPI003F4A302E